MDMAATVRETVSAMGITTTDGELEPVDSLTLLSVIMQLEETAGVRIPIEELEVENFRTVESVAELLTRLQREAAA